MLRTYVPHNFSADALAVIREANRICSAYAAQGYDLTLRQLYYQFVSRNLIRNKQSEYNRLGSIINDARLAGRLDWDYLVDRTRELDTLSHWDNPGGAYDWPRPAELILFATCQECEAEVSVSFEIDDPLDLHLLLTLLEENTTHQALRERLYES